MKVFVDSDVIISSLLSSVGASFFLLNHTGIDLYVSNFSIQELENVVKGLGIDSNQLSDLIEKKFHIVEIKKTFKEIKKEFGKNVVDENDAHIVAGAHLAKVRFLVTYKGKDFKTDVIKEDFDILVMKPGQLMQYMRSLG